MKTAGRENPNPRVALPRNRAHGAVGQDRSRSIKRAAKQEKFQPKEVCFFLTSPLIELIGRQSFKRRCRQQKKAQERRCLRKAVSVVLSYLGQGTADCVRADVSG